jgi:uncharacterized protein
MPPSPENGRGNGGKEMNTPEKKIILKGRKVIGGIASGEALVSKKPLMGWGNVDSKRGFTTERNHPLYEIPYKDKILVFTEPRGSGGFVSYGRSRAFGTQPAAFVYRRGNNLTVFAAMVANIPTVTDLDQDPTEVIETGDFVTVNGDAGTVEVIKKVR